MSRVLHKFLMATAAITAGAGVSSALDILLPNKGEPQKDFTEADQQAIDDATAKQKRKAAKRLAQKMKES